MKRFFTLLIAFFAAMSSFAQVQQKDVVVLNELYTDPGKTYAEFLEFFNSSLKPVDMDDYTVLLYYEESGVSGFYVVDLPAFTLDCNSYYVMAPTATFATQANPTVTADAA